MNKKLLLIVLLLGSYSVNADNKLKTVKDLVIEKNTLRTFVTVREKVESIMPFINLDCALMHPQLKINKIIPAGTELKVLEVSEPGEIDLATCPIAEFRQEYAFQFGKEMPLALRSRKVFIKTISDEYSRVYGMEMTVDKINRAFVSVQTPSGEEMKIRCETKLNTFEKKHVLPVFDTSGILTLEETPSIVNFTIKNGTKDQPWNLKDEPIRAKVGDIIRIFNADNIPHQLHTFGAPCPHGYGTFGEIKPRAHWDCVAEKPWNSFDINEGPLWDHLFGQEAQVWISVTPRD